MTAVNEQGRPSPSRDGVRLLAQAIVLAVLVTVAGVVGWLYTSERDWYAPAMALIVLSRFAYDRFFRN